jgi:hypothetical protein
VGGPQVSITAVNDLYAAAAEAESHYYTQADGLGVSKEHADRVLREAIFNAGRTGDRDPFEQARLQLVTDLDLK